MSEEFTTTINAPEYPPQIKHKVIFETFNKLKPGEAMQLINDHDPIHLKMQFDGTIAGLFTWEYLENGPVQFRVKIGRI